MGEMDQRVDDGCSVPPIAFQQAIDPGNDVLIIQTGIRDFRVIRITYIVGSKTLQHMATWSRISTCSTLKMLLSGVRVG